MKLNSTYSFINKFTLDLGFFPTLSITKSDLVWKLWEIVLLNKSILVITDKSSISSQIVFLLQSLIFPIQFKGRYFPYFTIYDKDLDNLGSPESQYNNLILGVTNPIFLRVNLAIFFWRYYALSKIKKILFFYFALEFFYLVYKKIKKLLFNHTQNIFYNKK